MTRLGILPLLLLLVPACSQFRPLSPEDLRGAGEIAPVGPSLPDREVLVYEGSWEGVPAGEAEFTFRREGEVRRSRATLKTVGVVSLLYGVTVEAEAVSGAEDMKTRSWSYSTGGMNAKRVQVRVDPESGHVLSVIRKGDEIERVELEAPGLLDPLATVYALRRADLTEGAGYRIDLFTEKHLYRAETLVGARERIAVPAGEFDAVRVRVDIRKLVDGEPEEKTRALEFWITGDGRIPVRIDADTKVGRISLVLSRYAQQEE